MTAVLILGWMTIAAVALIARLDYRVPRRLITDPASCADAHQRVRSPRLRSPHAVFRAPPLPQPVFVESK